MTALLMTALAGLFYVSGCSRAEKLERGVAKQVTVSAAMSLKDVMEEIKTLYSAQGAAINLNFGASGTLQHQIEQGAPVDIFISAAKKQVDDLDRKGLIDPSTRKNLLGNEVVLITPQAVDLVKDFKDLLKPEVKKIAIGNPEVVPAGKYAQETLVSLNLWNGLQQKLVFAKDVRQVLHYVESEIVDAGIVFFSDAVSSGKVRIAAKASKDLHQEVIYTAVVISYSEEKEAALNFLRYLAGPETAKVFAKYGFTPLATGR
ncbi:molybdenum ABC transporter periplasmic molybdate-binding protein [Calderihabitans maritimus]|uniref:Molybdenum ABC transporter periplasmic molybdate-binding protein n=2 Tax=Calderihabitans maritimus TaxID=1246530 RepID=A0A1Z5HWI1_9FIRM|nr:molybdenum ABC transporter periplasmic molybdate-binding protein [Calderihabitans maritimus]